jgi:uncharacterized protein YjbJ (UPF0337 family)
LSCSDRVLTVRVGGVRAPAGTDHDEWRCVVGFADKFRNKSQELRGRIKRNTGEVTGDRGLQAEGRADEMKSSLKQTGEEVKDAFRGRRTRRRY